MIRFVGVDAAPLLADLHARAFDQPWPESDFRTLLDNPTAFAILAEDETANTFVGFILAWAPSEDAEILTLAIAPPARRKGLGAALTEAACAAAAARGARAMLLEVADTNAPARALYAKLGFTEHARRDRYYANGADALILRAALHT